MAKYRILKDHEHWNGSMRYIPQVHAADGWKNLPAYTGGHVHFHTARDIIEAHKQTGTPCTVAWDDDPKPRRWWQFWKRE